GQPLGDRASILTGRAAGLAEPRTGIRQHPGLTQATPVGASRDFQEACALDLAHGELRGDLEQRLSSRRSVWPRGEALAPQDHHLLAILCQLEGQLAERFEILARGLDEL